MLCNRARVITLLLQVKVRKDPKFAESPLFACDQICSSDISSVPGNGREISFPIHPTNPATPIIYIATQKEQLVTLRFVIAGF